MLLCSTPVTPFPQAHPCKGFGQAVAAEEGEAAHGQEGGLVRLPLLERHRLGVLAAAHAHHRALADDEVGGHVLHPLLGHDAQVELGPARAKQVVCTARRAAVAGAAGAGAVAGGLSAQRVEELHSRAAMPRKVVGSVVIRSNPARVGGRGRRGRLGGGGGGALAAARLTAGR